VVEPILEVRGVSFRFSDGLEALSEVNLAVERGQSVGLVGPNGAGKTTLFLTLIGVRQPTEGRITVGGKDVSNSSDLDAIRQTVGLLFQDPDDQLFCAAVFDDVAFGPLNLGVSAEETRRRVAEALQRVGMAGAEKRIPHHLSAGEKRRVALATVLSMRPEILVLDEPTNDLDPRGRRQLIDLVNSFKQTKLIASHDLEFVLATCKRVLVLDEGHIVADGLAEEVLADAACMEAHGLEVPPSLDGRR